MIAQAIPIVIAIVGVAAVVLALYVWKRPSHAGFIQWFKERRLLRLMSEKKIDQAVDELLRQARVRAAAEFLLEQGQYNRGMNLLMEHKEFSVGAKLALAAGKTDDAVTLFQQANDYAAAASLLERSGRGPEAVKVYMKGGHTRAAADAVLRFGQEREISAVADWLMKRGDNELAIPLLHKVNRFPDLGRVQEQLGRYGEALAAYELCDAFVDAARIYTAQGEHRRAAYVLLRGGKVQEAIGALIADGDYLAAARLYRRHGDAAAALDVLQKVQPGNELFRKASLFAATIFEEHHRFAETVQCLVGLLEHEGYGDENAELLYRVVDLQIHIGDYDAAVRTLETAKQAGATSPAIDEQLMLLGKAEEEVLVEPDKAEEGARQKRKLREVSTTILFPKLDRYQLKRKLARGGHGVLFLVHDKERKEDVVLKVLHSQSLPTELARRYFLREARTASSIRHPNVVRVYDVGEYEGRLFISMEFVDGQNLLEMFDSVSNPMSVDFKLHICLQLCDAMGHAHSLNIVHRDIKMSNVMVNRVGQVKLTDFGLAKVLDEDAARSLLVMGTPDYMSPEQLAGDFVDARADLFSFGVLMYRLFTEHDPFEDQGVFTEERFKTPSPPTDHVPNLSPVLAETIIRCLRYRREDRSQSAAEVAAGLRRALEAHRKPGL